MLKKTTLLLLSIVLAISLFSACALNLPEGIGSTQPSNSEKPHETETTPPTLTIPPVDLLPGIGLTVLDGIIEGAKQRYDRFPACATADILGAENAPNYLGMSADEISQYLSGAWLSNALIMGGGAYQTAMVTVKYQAETGAVAALMSNFNYKRWICEFPEVCETVVIGPHVFLIASKLEIAEAIKAEIADEAGVSIDSLIVNRFYEHTAGSEDEGGGLDFGSLVPG